MELKSHRGASAAVDLNRIEGRSSPVDQITPRGRHRGHWNALWLRGALLAAVPSIAACGGAPFVLIDDVAQPDAAADGAMASDGLQHSDDSDPAAIDADHLDAADDTDVGVPDVISDTGHAVTDSSPADAPIAPVDAPTGDVCAAPSNWNCGIGLTPINAPTMYCVHLPSSGVGYKEYTPPACKCSYTCACVLTAMPKICNDFTLPNMPPLMIAGCADTANGQPGVTIECR